MKIYLFIVLISFSSAIFAQRPFFYSGKKYGSESLYNPINLLLNGSYDIIQLQHHNRNIWRFPYYKSAQNVFNNLLNPFRQISKYGWSKFFTSEIFPLNLKTKGAQWWPNYQLHLIGGGMTYVAMTEWYSSHNFPNPKLFSLTTMVIYHLLNEIVENNKYQGTNVDPIADIYIFDIGGIILFSFDSVKNFFSKKLNLADWSLQPSFLLNDGTLNNNGQYFSIKYKIPFWKKWYLFYYFGMNGLTGLSYEFEHDKTISLGLGLRAKKLVSLRDKVRIDYIKTTWNVGLFYDIDNSLMSSLFFSGLTDYNIQLNIYPGILKIGNFSPGLWFVYQTNGNILWGINTIWTPGIGFDIK